jgi:ribonuclease HII
MIDSKTLSEAQRDAYFQKIVDNSNHAIRYATTILSPQELSYKMLRMYDDSLSPSFANISDIYRNKYNLNWISHDAAIGLIRKVLAKGVNVTEVTYALIPTLFPSVLLLFF